jgi:cysteine-rich repeat protein
MGCVHRSVSGSALAALAFVAAACVAGLACPYGFPPATGQASCGDGVVSSGEECDDGNGAPGDGCTEVCTVEQGWACEQEPSECATVCGDGDLVTDSEECDDGNVQPGDGCSAQCRIEDGWTCEQEPSECATVCGDGVLAGGETCDDGNKAYGDGCSGDCLVECTNGSVTDCNWPSTTLNPEAAFVDPTPPGGFIQCAGFENTEQDDVSHLWETGCLGEAKTLRIRIWDTSRDPWLLLADSTLVPQSNELWEPQTFDATEHGGTEGLLSSGGVTLLKDSTDVNEPSFEWCDLPGLANDYGANDLYAPNRSGTKTLWVCSMDDDYATKVCTPSREITLVSCPPETCSLGCDGINTMAIAIYEGRDDG